MKPYKGYTTIVSHNDKLIDVANSAHRGGSREHCLGACAGCLGRCYDNKAVRRRPSVRNARDKNYLILSTSPQQWFVDHDDYLRDRKPLYFRFNESGDFVNQDHVNMVYQLCRMHPTIHFGTYTKRWRSTDRLDFRGKPDNLQLFFSVWPDMTDAKNGEVYAWRVAYTLYKGMELPPNTFLCPGKCGPECHVCYEPTIFRNVAFNLH